MIITVRLINISPIVMIFVCVVRASEIFSQQTFEFKIVVLSIEFMLYIRSIESLIPYD